MSVFDDLARQSGAEIVVAIDLRSADPETGEFTYYRLTDASNLHTLPEDDPPNTTYRAMIAKGGVRTKRALTAQPEFTGKMPPNRAWFSVYNGTGALGNWRQQSWVGQPVTIRAGGEVTATGEPYPFSEFVPYFTGTLRGKPTAESGQVVRFEAVGATTPSSEQPVVVDTYRALNGALWLAPPDGIAISTADITLTAPLTWESIGRVDALPTTDGGLFRHRFNFGLAVLPNGKLVFQYGVASLHATTFTVAPGADLYAAATLEGDSQTVKVYAGTSVFDIAEVLSVSVPTIDLTLDNLIFGRIGGPDLTETFDATIYESRIWSTVKTLPELASAAGEPIDAGAADLVEVFRFGEGTGSVTFGSLGTFALTVGTGADFASSIEGDDPARGGSLLGQTKPRAWGAPFRLPLAWVDSQTNQAQWSYGPPSSDMVNLYLNGGKMLPDVGFETENDGDISWDNTGPTGGALILLPGLGFDFRHFVPGQDDPVVLGQLIELVPGLDTPPELSLRDYRIAEKSADNLRVELVDVDGNPLVGLPAPTPLLAETIVVSAETESIFTWDLNNSTVALARSPGGELTVDAICEGGADLTASEGFEIVADAPVTNQLVVDPVVGFAVAPGEDVKVGDLLDEIAASCFGYRAEDRDGGHVLGSYAPPSGNPVAALIGSTPAELESRGVTLPAIVGKIQAINERHAIPPVWQVRVGHDKTWKLTEGAAGVVNNTDRQRLTTTWREVKRTFAEIRKVPGTDPMPEPLATYIVGRADAEAVADQLAVPVLTAKRRWPALTVEGIPTLALNLGDEVLVEHPDEDFGLTDPVPAVVWSLEEDSASNITQIGVWL